MSLRHYIREDDTVDRYVPQLERPQRWAITFAIAALLILVTLIAARPADAQTLPGELTLRWTLPTTGCITVVTPPLCNQSLTGSAALTGVVVYISTSPIPDAPTTAPTLTLAAGATTTVHTMQVANGATLYARVAARTQGGTGPLSVQVSKLVAADVIPGAPTNVTIELQIGT